MYAEKDKRLFGVYRVLTLCINKTVLKTIKNKTCLAMFCLIRIILRITKMRLVLVELVATMKLLYT